jgi:hypothetical protein
MVNQFDFQELTGTNQIARHLDVGIRWYGFTVRMIMDDDDRSRRGDDGATKHFTRMYQDGDGWNELVDYALNW